MLMWDKFILNKEILLFENFRNSLLSEDGPIVQKISFFINTYFSPTGVGKFIFL